MKKILLFMLVAIVGGLAALGGAQFLGLTTQEVKYVEVPAQQPTSYANFTDPARGPAAVPSEGFVTAADKALPAVVHIKASKPAGMAMRGGRGGGMPFGIDPDDLPDAFRDLFGNPGGGRQGVPDGDREMPLQQGSGSGVIISADGYIVTNNHVVEDAQDLKVVLNDERTYDAEIIGVDPTTDIALIKIGAESLPTIKFGNSDAIRIGEWVVAVGNPFSLTSTVTAGIVSAKGRSIDIIGNRGENKYAIESFIQTDAVVNPGNSGGALVNTNGDLVGINTAISSPTGVFAGYSFAVPSAIVKKVVDDLKEFGVVQRGLLGASIVQLNTETAKEFGVERDNGVYVNEVLPESAALEAGLQKGDVIIAADGVRTLRNSALLEQLGRRRPGDEVVLTIERAGKERKIPVRLKNRAGDTGVVRAVVKDMVSVDDLGLDVVELDKETAMTYDVPGGVVVTELRRGALTEQTRIQEGFVITSVNGVPVRKAMNFERALEMNGQSVVLEGFYPADPEKTVRYAVAR